MNLMKEREELKELYFGDIYARQLKNEDSVNGKVNAYKNAVRFDSMYQKIVLVLADGTYAVYEIRSDYWDNDVNLTFTRSGLDPSTMVEVGLIETGEYENYQAALKRLDDRAHEQSDRMMYEKLKRKFEGE